MSSRNQPRVFAMRCIVRISYCDLGTNDAMGCSTLAADSVKYSAGEPDDSYPGYAESLNCSAASAPCTASMARSIPNDAIPSVRNVRPGPGLVATPLPHQA